MEEDRGLTAANPLVSPSLRCFRKSLVFRVAERGGNLLFAQARPIVAINRQRDAAVLLQVARPAQGAIKAVEFLEQKPLFLQRRHCAGAGWTAEHSISHGQSSCTLRTTLRATAVFRGVR